MTATHTAEEECDMQRLAPLIVAAALALGPGAASAKLPPPTPAEQAQLQAKAAAKAAATKRQERELAEIQDEVAHRYRARHPRYAASHASSGWNLPLTKANVPKAARQPPGVRGAPPTERQPNPQAEAHSNSNSNG
jgi:hypothetical protein